MFRAAVIYAPAALQKAAERVASFLDRKRFQVNLKPAAQASGPDLAAADLVLLGSTAEGRSGLPAEFAEILRVLGGIDLSGRVAGLFAAGSDAPLAAWRKALKDCGIRLEDSLLRADAADDRAVGGWVNALARRVEEPAGGR